MYNNTLTAAMTSQVTRMLRSNDHNTEVQQPSHLRGHDITGKVYHDQIAKIFEVVVVVVHRSCPTQTNWLIYVYIYITEKMKSLHG